MATGGGLYDGGAKTGSVKLKPAWDHGAQSKAAPDLARTHPASDGAAPHLPALKATATFYDLARTHAATLGDGGRDFLGSRKGAEWTWVTFDDALRRSQAFSSGLAPKAIDEGPAALVLVFSAHRPEVTLADLSLSVHGRVAIHLHPATKLPVLVSIINSSGIKMVIVDNGERLDRLLDAKKDCPSLVEVVIMDGEASPEQSKKLDELKVAISTWEEVEESGDPPPHVHNPPKPSDPATLLVTRSSPSPKTVPVTNGALVTQTAALQHVFAVANVGVDDILLSTTHLSSVSQRTMELAAYAFGLKLGYGDNLLEDAPSLKPTILFALPTELAALRRKAVAMPGVAAAVKAKEADLAASKLTNSGPHDAALAPARELVGGLVKLVVTSHESLSPALANFVRLALGCPVVELYVAAETGIVAHSDPADLGSAGHVGAPSPCLRLKLQDVPELGLMAAEGVGEVSVKGAGVATGYWKEAAGKNMKDGYLLLGDVAEWGGKGELRLLGRKSEAWGLGKAVGALGRVEAVWGRSELVSAVCAVEKGGKVGALVVSKGDKAAILASLKAEVAESGLEWGTPVGVAVVGELEMGPPPCPRPNRAAIAATHAAAIASLFT